MKQMVSMEKTYGKTLKGLMHAVNPIKKKIINTKCLVHKFINIQAVDILRHEGYCIEGDFFKSHLKCLNEGVVWADQDFKSTNHFYHATLEKGLYGFSDALSECKKYYNTSCSYYKAGDVNKAMCYLGASCHLIQDATVPQHVNNNLLKSHRDFEQWIISRIFSDYAFVETSGIISFDSIDDYIKNNAKLAVETYNKYSHIDDKDLRYYNITNSIIRQAQKSTAGFMLNYYKEINNFSNI